MDGGSGHHGRGSVTPTDSGRGLGVCYGLHGESIRFV